MMNMFEVGERLKDFSKDQLVKEMQAPSGLAPQFMVLSELQRRMRMEQAMKSDGQGAPQTTVAEDAVAAAGVPQGGVADMARALAPKTDMTQNTGVAPVPAMAEGGVVSMQAGGVLTDPAFMLQARRMGMSPQEYLDSLGPAQRRMEEARVARNRMLAMEPRGDGMTFPSQEDLDRSAQEEALGMRASRALTAPAEGGGLSDIPTTLEPVRRGAITGLPRGPRGFSPLSFDTPLAAERAAAEPPSVPLNAIEEMYLRENRSGPPRRTAPLTPLEYGPPRRRPADVEPRVDVPPVDEFSALGVGEPAAPVPVPSLVDPELPPYYTLRRLMFPGEDPEVARRAMEERRDSRTVEDTTPVDEVGPLPLVTTEPTTPATEDIARTFESEAEADDAARVAKDTAAPDKKTTAPAGAGAPGAGGALPEFDRMLEQDKWLSLARFGMALMSSQAPTFGQALGEAGTVGLDALGKARADYLERKQTAELMALRRAAAGGKGRGSQFPATGANLLNARIEALTTQLNDPTVTTNPARRAELQAQLDDLLLQERLLQAAYLSQYSLEGVLGASAPRGGSGTVSADISDD